MADSQGLAGNVDTGLDGSSESLAAGDELVQTASGKEMVFLHHPGRGWNEDIKICGSGKSLSIGDVLRWRRLCLGMCDWETTVTQVNGQLDQKGRREMAVSRSMFMLFSLKYLKKQVWRQILRKCH